MRCLGQRVGRVAARTAGPRSSEIGTLTTYPGSTSESERAGSAFAAPHRSVARFPDSFQKSRAYFRSVRYPLWHIPRGVCKYPRGYPT
jgi:hypothetical protein